MKSFARRTALAVFAIAVAGGMTAPAFAEKPDQNERPCNGNSKHHGQQGGGVCPGPKRP